MRIPVKFKMLMHRAILKAKNAHLCMCKTVCNLNPPLNCRKMYKRYTDPVKRKEMSERDYNPPID